MWLFQCGKFSLSLVNLSCYTLSFEHALCPLVLIFSTQIVVDHRGCLIVGFGVLPVELVWVVGDFVGGGKGVLVLAALLAIN